MPASPGRTTFQPLLPRPVAATRRTAAPKTRVSRPELAEAVPESLVLRALRPGAARDAAIGLLSAAGRSQAHVLAWAERGQVLALSDPATEPEENLLGAALVLPIGGESTLELRVAAVAEARRGEDLGPRLMTHLTHALQASGARRVLAAASNADSAYMALLQRAGFRYCHVERDACTRERGWADHVPAGSVPRRDVVWFDLEL